MTQEEAIKLLNNITSYCDFEDEYGDMIDSEPYYEAVELAIKALEQQSKTGHWEQYGDSWEDKFKCSECGKEQPKILCGERIIGHWSDYCPNCGARMAESEDKE
jgi:DNA-directed RNA polymerase subunit RPC12/RpoP